MAIFTVEIIGSDFNALPPKLTEKLINSDKVTIETKPDPQSEHRTMRLTIGYRYSDYNKWLLSLNSFLNTFTGSQIINKLLSYL